MRPFVLGRYDVLLPIGEGGTARVYLARARGAGGFQRPVAIKVLHRDGVDEGLAADLLDEANLAAHVRHPNVVSVLDVGESDDALYLVMDYVEGESLTGLVRRAKRRGAVVPLPVRIRILLDALEGLHATHEATDDAGAPLELIHRDFTPQNILAGRDGHARLVDFGIAKPAAREGHTRSGIVKGKVHYMAPEQVHGDGTIDRRCDVWAAAVIAWETFADRRLWTGDSDVGIAVRVVSETPPLLGSVVPSVPDAIDDAIAWGLVRDLRGRCPTAAAFRERLLDACRQSGLVAEPGEVAAIVEREAGEVLRQRRAAIRAVEMPGATSAAHEEANGSGARRSEAPSASPPAPATSAEAVARGAPPSPPVPPAGAPPLPPADAPPVPSARAPADVPAPAQHHSPDAPATGARAPRRWVGVGVAVALAALAVIATIAWRAAGPAGQPSPSAVTSTESPSPEGTSPEVTAPNGAHVPDVGARGAVEPGAPASAASGLPSAATSSEEVGASDAAPRAEPAAPARRGPGHRRPPPPPAKTVEPLAPNPYGGER